MFLCQGQFGLVQDSAKKCFYFCIITVVSCGSRLPLQMLEVLLL